MNCRVIVTNTCVRWSSNVSISQGCKAEWGLPSKVQEGHSLDRQLIFALRFIIKYYLMICFGKLGCASMLPPDAFKFCAKTEVASDWLISAFAKMSREVFKALLCLHCSCLLMRPHLAVSSNILPNMYLEFSFL